MDFVETVAEAARTETAPTRAMPIISAPAVFAVRLGWRTTLPRARRPSGLTPATNTAARTPRERRAITGARSSTPTTRPSAPRPSRVEPLDSGATRAEISPAAPGTTTSSPAIVRVRRDFSVAVASRMASTGAVNAARRAGRAAATTLTTVPMTSEMTTVEVSNGMDPDRSMPTCSNPIRSNETRPSPAAIPRADPTRPTTAAWVRMEANTWVGEAPMARSRANSRIRSRTDMENVLEMMNAPTNRDIPAKTSMNVATNPSWLWMSVRASARIASPVRACAAAALSCARTGVRSATRSASDTPGFAYTLIVDTMPSAA